MVAANENRGPSVAELQKFVREKNRVEFLLVNGERLTGVLRWFDEHAFCLVEEGDQTVTLLRQAVVAYRAAQS